MEIKINLPINGSANTYSELRHSLKQMELSIHHAQKAIDSAEDSGVDITEDAFMSFKYPSLDNKIEMDYYEELQYVELCINLE